MDQPETSDFVWLSADRFVAEGQRNQAFNDRFITATRERDNIALIQEYRITRIM
jgi:hypothetical protein